MGTCIKELHHLAQSREALTFLSQGHRSGGWRPTALPPIGFPHASFASPHSPMPGTRCLQRCLPEKRWLFWKCPWLSRGRQDSVPEEDPENMAEPNLPPSRLPGLCPLSLVRAVPIDLHIRPSEHMCVRESVGSGSPRYFMMVCGGLRSWGE